MGEKNTATLDRLYLEWSQFTKARTNREIEQARRIAYLEGKMDGDRLPLLGEIDDLRKYVQYLEANCNLSTAAERDELISLRAENEKLRRVARAAEVAGRMFAGKITERDFESLIGSRGADLRDALADLPPGTLEEPTRSATEVTK